jgi:uncharacterized membrane protein
LHIIRPFCADAVDAKAGGCVTESKGWLIKRNCSAGPRPLALVFASLVAVSFTFGVAFAAQGLWMVLPFVGLEIVAVAAAFLTYGRHAADFERIELRDGRLIVEKHVGSRRSEYVFDLPWVRVDMEERGVDLGTCVRVELVSARQRVEIGRYLVDVGRAELGREIRAALGRAAPRGM